jgi:hypothetical protein
MFCSESELAMLLVHLVVTQVFNPKRGLRIDDFVITLRDPGETLVGLNETARSDFIKTFHSIGNNVVDTYGNLIKYTSVNDDIGPPFWYFGPSPPDEVILQETVNLPINAKTIISS